MLHNSVYKLQLQGTCLLFQLGSLRHTHKHSTATKQNHFWKCYLTSRTQIELDNNNLSLQIEQSVNFLDIHNVSSQNSSSVSTPVCE